jgi:hypothetical protein
LINQHKGTASPEHFPQGAQTGATGPNNGDIDLDFGFHGKAHPSGKRKLKTLRRKREGFGSKKHYSILVE